MIINITYAFFDTFGMIDVIVKNEPGNNPVTLVYKVYLDGFRGNDLGGSSAQSVILMAMVFAPDNHSVPPDRAARALHVRARRPGRPGGR